ncbi:MAG: hypothetical protein Q4G43_06910 [Mobilicoccus sp.]|nr:hypothetical protein [Mobilicoccus sp.]
MFTTDWDVEVPGPREWPTLRDLYVRADDPHRHDHLAQVVADADRPADAWRGRLADMLGPGRLALFVRDRERRPRGFVSAYTDGHDDSLVVILRILLVVPSPQVDVGARAAHLLLDHVEDWASAKDAVEVLCELDEDDDGTATVLRARGYTSSVGRPGLGQGDPVAVEWSRTVGRLRDRMSRGLFAVA